MKQPRCPPEYEVVSGTATGDHLKYFCETQKEYIKYLRIILKKDGTFRSVANITEHGKVWEIWDAGTGSHNITSFPSLDEALNYVEAKMNLGILGDKE